VLCDVNQYCFLLLPQARILFLVVYLNKGANDGVCSSFYFWYCVEGVYKNTGSVRHRLISITKINPNNQTKTNVNTDVV